MVSTVDNIIISYILVQIHHVIVVIKGGPVYYKLNLLPI